MKTVGIVDLGSNTARMVVYAYESGRWFRLVDDIREPVRLGEGLWATGRLKKAAINRAMASLKLFSDYHRARGLDSVKIIGTSAVRDAENSRAFLDRVRGLDLDVGILTGEQEARLGNLAVANGFALQDAWVMDLGGGSVQISRMQDRQFAHGASYPLGAVRLTESFLDSDPSDPAEVARLEAEIEHHLGEVAERMSRDSAPLVAMGGTVRNLALHAQSEAEYPYPLLHGYTLERDDLEWMTDQLLQTPVAARSKLRGISSYRADVILAGALVYRWLARVGSRSGILISGHGVREGAFFQHFLPRPPHLLENVRRFSVRNLFERAAQPEQHTDRVRYLARRLFECLTPLHELGPEYAELLDAAAVLHDIGTAVHYYSHHKHGAYLVSAAPLDGFSHREQAFIRQLVRYHHRGIPKRTPYRELILSKEKPALLSLATCLRLAEYLERSRAARIQDVDVQLGRKKVRLFLVADEEPTVEMWETMKQAGLFERAFHRKLVLEHVSSREAIEAKSADAD